MYTLIIVLGVSLLLNTAQYIYSLELRQNNDDLEDELNDSKHYTHVLGRENLILDNNLGHLLDFQEVMTDKELLKIEKRLEDSKKPKVEKKPKTKAKKVKKTKK